MTIAYINTMQYNTVVELIHSSINHNTFLCRNTMITDMNIRWLCDIQLMSVLDRLEKAPVYKC